MDQLRGLAILLVVAFHGRTVLARFAPDLPPELGSALALFAPFRMPLLVFLSGMLLGRSLAKPAAAFVRGKARGLAWPYLVWSLLFLLVSAQVSAGNVVELLWDAPPHLWYLQHLFVYYLAARLLRAAHVPLTAAAGAALLASFPVEGVGGRRLLLLFVFFVAGHVLAEHRDRLRPARRGAWVAAASVVAVASSLLSAAGTDLKYEPEWVGAGAAGIAVCLLLAPRWEGSRIGPLLGYVGRESLVFYVSHFLVLWALGWWFREAGLQASLGLYAAGVAVALAAGFALAHLRHRSRLVAALFEPPPLPRLR